MRTRSLSLTLLFAAVACVPRPVVTPTPLVRATGTLLRIEDTRRDAPVLDSLLRSGDRDIRARAAYTAGRIGARRTLPRLRELTQDPDTLVAARAFFSLGLLYDTASATLARTALTRPSRVAEEAAWLLGQIGEHARGNLVGALRDQSLGAEVRGALLLAASRLRPVPAHEAEALLHDADSAVAWRAAYVIARGRGLPAIRSLLGEADSPWATVREQVARGAARGLAADSLGVLAIGALHRLMLDSSAHVRVNAVRSLASYGPGEREPVLQLLADRDAGVRLAAATALEGVLDSSAGEWTSAYERADTAFAVRQAIMTAAARRGVVLPIVEDWAHSTDWRFRAAVAGAMERPPLSDDPDGRVRAAALGRLVAMPDTSRAPGWRPLLRQRLTDTDVGVRAAATSALARGATADDLAPALAAYAMAQSDTDGDARLAFWQLADSVVARQPSLPAALDSALSRIVRPADPLERRSAARIPRFAAWADAQPSARSLEWYEARARDMDSRPVLRIETERGTMRIELRPEEAPLTVWNITSLARAGYFDGQRWHRVVPNFVVQGGDPRGDGNGGPGYAIRDELNRLRYGRGAVGMALSGPDTGGSQFFITHSAQPHLDGGYTVFGQLREGAAVLDALVQGDRILRVTVE